MNQLAQYFGIIAMCMMAIGCDSKPIPSNVRSAASSGQVGEAEQSSKDGSVNELKAGKGNGDDQKIKSDGDSVADEQSANESQDGTEQADEPKNTEGKQFFLDNVEVAFKENCTECHKLPKDNPTIEGPLSIFDYESMISLLKQGNSYSDNELIKKLRSIVSHEGGDVCGDDYTKGLCSQVLSWWEKEYGPAPKEEEPDPGNLVSELEDITNTGEVYGFAALSSYPDENVEVKIYIDGIMGTGTELDPVTANKPGYSGGVSGSHKFQFTLPDNYKNGVQHKLYAYALFNNEYVQLVNSPYIYTAYTAKGSDIYYDNNVKSVMQNSCNGCHQRSYAGDFIHMLNPTPRDGGTETQNTFYQKANGIGHSGGDRCDQTCENVLKAWYGSEFK